MNARNTASFFVTMFSLLCLSVLLPYVTVAQNPIKAIIDSYGYGYQVKVSINGMPIKVIAGKGQQATRLFSADHPMLAEASEEQKDLFILREGKNSILVEFRKLDDGQTPLQVKLEIPDRYSRPLFHLTSSTRTTGKVEKTFWIDRTMPEGFRTIAVNDSTL